MTKSSTPTKMWGRHRFRNISSVVIYYWWCDTKQIMCKWIHFHVCPPSLYNTFSIFCIMLVEVEMDVCVCLCVDFQGRITVTGLLDRERGDLYTLTVVADDGGPKKDSTVVRSIHGLCFFLSACIHWLYYRICGSCSVIENLKSFFFCLLHPSLELQKVRSGSFLYRTWKVIKFGPIHL